MEELEEHRAQMHFGYSFTGDNVDMRVLPRQMTIKNKAKDHHMFQTVAFKNRISPNHLPYHRAIYNIPSKCRGAVAAC